MPWRSHKAAAAQRRHFVVFDVAASRCALPRAEVRELLPLPRLSRPPGLPKAVAGFLNLAGAAVPVVDAARLLGLASADDEVEPGLYQHLILIRRGPGPDVALLVDRVVDVISIAPERLTPISDADTLNGCVAGEIDTGGGPIHVISGERLFLEEERQALADFAKSAAERLRDWAAPHP